ncbi:MAG: hypothetical protein SFW09_04890 [Hyphomicrobiaceae bacterium]|nr:hypothetical protein [Hyphomicrobiaceae bacterium]
MPILRSPKTHLLEQRVVDFGAAIGTLGVVLLLVECVLTSVIMIRDTSLRAPDVGSYLGLHILILGGVLMVAGSLLNVLRRELRWRRYKEIREARREVPPTTSR